MEVKHSDNKKDGSFYIQHDGNKQAELSYRHTGERQITIDHTEVKDTLKGQGIGHQLIDAAVEYLRKNNLKAVAECPFVKSMFEKRSDELKDIIA